MARQSERERLQELTCMERKFWEKEIFPAGMDEVGRGPLAGPVVAACVILPPAPLIEYVNDSKRFRNAGARCLLPSFGKLRLR